MPGKTRLRYDLLRVKWDAKPYTLTHSGDDVHIPSGPEVSDLPTMLSHLLSAVRDKSETTGGQVANGQRPAGVLFPVIIQLIVNHGWMIGQITPTARTPVVQPTKIASKFVVASIFRLQLVVSYGRCDCVLPLRIHPFWDDVRWKSRCMVE